MTMRGRAAEELATMASTLPATASTSDAGHKGRPVMNLLWGLGETAQDERSREDLVGHRGGEPSGEGVLLARVIAPENRQRVERYLGSVAEGGARGWHRTARPGERGQQRLT